MILRLVLMVADTYNGRVIDGTVSGDTGTQTYIHPKGIAHAWVMSM